ncbi:MAG TPA: threonine synthase [Geminicoccaceae bacterium]|nr:threonine synthase [Geminicoccaceae bacterium]
MIRYVSTRGRAEPLDFEGALLAGLATDGGLYVPESWPQLSAEQLRALRGQPYAELATEVLWPFVAGSLPKDRLAAHAATAYGAFAHRAVAPLKQLGPNAWLMELFHGPTLAFKDFALQLLGLLFEDVLARRQRSITIVGATSGDTGSAAIRAVAGRARMQIVMLHPRGRVSEVQRRQMTTVPDANVHNVAIEGTFDDCQALVKALFNDLAFRAEARLAAVNSINWARIAAQVPYYVHAALALGGPDRPVAFAVPTGNFGDVYAGWVAARIGLPVARLVVATNRNDILARFLATGRYETGEVHPTISPSMDIQVASNFERLLLDLLGGPDAVRTAMEDFARTGSLAVDEARLAGAAALFTGCRVDEDATRRSMADTLRAAGELVDPHTAVALAAAAAARGDPAVPMVTLATAHPAKFPDAVAAATGVHPGLPPHMADLYEQPERYDMLANDLEALKAHIRARALGTA